MLKDKLYEDLQEIIRDEATANQLTFFKEVADFIYQNETRVFLLSGYAGTGKTTAIAALSNVLPKMNFRILLMAPTGRAAKVMENYSGRSATTIHRIIYNTQVLTNGETVFKLARNSFKNAIFIIDEASMVGNKKDGESSFSQGGGLLDDLIDFIFDGDNCKLILVGDPAQLPPVHELKSVALDENYIKAKYRLRTKSVFFEEIMRQNDDSIIINNATDIRYRIDTNSYLPLFNDFNSDFSPIPSNELTETLDDCYSRYGKEEVILLTPTNKRANLFNKQIRTQIFRREEEYSSGDLIMVVRNNFFWGDEVPGMNFIANGEIGEITAVLAMEEKYGFPFMKALIHFPYSKSKEVEAIVNLQTVYAESASMSFEDSNNLYQQVAAEYSHIPNKNLRQLKIKANPYLNALQIKFAYSITGHKSQGGQWAAVFIDQGWLPEERINASYLRWLYTAVTRAKEKVYLVNFNPKYLNIHEESYF